MIYLFRWILWLRSNLHLTVSGSMNFFLKTNGFICQNFVQKGMKFRYQTKRKDMQSRERKWTWKAHDEGEISDILSTLSFSLSTCKDQLIAHDWFHLFECNELKKWSEKSLHVWVQKAISAISAKINCSCCSYTNCSCSQCQYQSVVINHHLWWFKIIINIKKTMFWHLNDEKSEKCHSLHSLPTPPKQLYNQCELIYSSNTLALCALCIDKLEVGNHRFFKYISLN